jgi:hypothetical protein
MEGLTVRLWRYLLRSFQTQEFAVLLLLLVVILGLGKYSNGENLGSSVFYNILSTAVAALWLSLYPRLWALMGEERERRQFLKFFGAVTGETRGALLMFSYRKLNQAHNKPEIWDTEIVKHVPAAKDALAEGLNSWVPLQDLRGANYVAGEIAKVAKKTPYFRTDRDLVSDPVDQIRATVISFGLGFNQFTHRVVCCTGRKLFEVAFCKNPERSDGSPGLETDQIVIPNFGTLAYDKDTGVDYAIVVRVPYEVPADARSRCFFICAGRTASGTAVAGRYLAAHWKDMMRLYRKPPDEEPKKPKDLKIDALLVVIAHRYHSADSEDDAGEIAFEGDKNEKQLIRWWSPKDNPMHAKKRA